MIPCVFGDCVLPQELRCYVHLYFNKHNPFCDPWYKLRTAISPNINKALTNKLDTDFNFNTLVLFIVLFFFF